MCSALSPFSLALVTFLIVLSVGRSAACNITLDPINVARWNGDYSAVPLPSGSTLAACEAMCCDNVPTCVAFSFNSPQPTDTCVGGSCCKAGGVCCMLKSSLGHLQNNTDPNSVRTGYLTLSKGPGPTPPFPPSTLITGVTFGPVGYWSGTNGDTWPSAWAADGSLYGWACDSSHGFGYTPMALFRLDGDPRMGTLNPVLIANDPIDYTKLCAYLGPTGNYPNISLKPAGMAALPASPSLPNGTLVVGASCQNYGDDAVFNRQHNLAGFVAASVDGGVTWSNITAVGAFAGRFSAPVFVSCGQGNDACTAINGDTLYVFFPGAFDNAAYWDNNDAMFLGRVSSSSIGDVSSYSYYAGLDGSGNPIWTPDASQAQPSLQFGNMVGENAVSYHPYLKRYLIANFGLIDNSGYPRPWHTQPFMMPHRTQLTMFESVNPWGPWSIFFRDDDSVNQAPGMYTPTFPSSYMQPIIDGKTELVMFFACLGGASDCRYTLNWQNVTLTVA